MNLEFFYQDGYGQFIWPAYTFTFVSCLILYLKTKKELKKQEKIFFNEYEELHAIGIKTIERKKNIKTKEALSSSSI